MDHWSALKVMASSKTQCVSITFWKRAAQALMQRRRRFHSCSIQSRVVSLKSSTQMFQRTSLTTIRTSCKQFWQQIITVTLQFTLFFAQRFLVPAVVVCDVQRRLLLLRLPIFFCLPLFMSYHHMRCVNVCLVVFRRKFARLMRLLLQAGDDTESPIIDYLKINKDALGRIRRYRLGFLGLIIGFFGQFDSQNR